MKKSVNSEHQEHHQKDLQKKLLKAQRLEITEHIIYEKLAVTARGKNKKILSDIAAMELDHYNFFKKLTKQDVHPNKFKIHFYYMLAKVLGINFGVKLMEHEEHLAQHMYVHIIQHVPSAQKIMEDEKNHEHQLIELLHEKKLDYIGSIVLGLNDALVELTGALAGLTLALQNTKLIAVVGLITGIAASLSMAASEYLSIKSEKNTKQNPFIAALYTGMAYIGTVIVLVMPYFLLSNPYAALPITLILGLCIIAIFTAYSSIIKQDSFWKRFAEMALISLSVAAISFVIGILIRTFIGIEV